MKLVGTHRNGKLQRASVNWIGPDGQEAYLLLASVLEDLPNIVPCDYASLSIRVANVRMIKGWG